MSKIVFRLSGKKNKDLFQPNNAYQLSKIVNNTIGNKIKLLQSELESKKELLSKNSGYNKKIVSKKLSILVDKKKNIDIELRQLKRDQTFFKKKNIKLSKNIKSLSDAKIRKKLNLGKNQSDKIKITKLINSLESPISKRKRTKAEIRKELNEITDGKYSRLLRKRKNLEKQRVEGIKWSGAIDSATSSFSDSISDLTEPTLKNDGIEFNVRNELDPFKLKYEKAADKISNNPIINVENAIRRINELFSLDAERNGENISEGSEGWITRVFEILQQSGFANADEFYSEIIKYGLEDIIDLDFKEQFID